MAERAEVLRFWRSVELFGPQDVPSPDRDGVYDLDGGSLAPWEAGHSLGARPLRPRERWRHTVYCGVFERETAFELIRERFPTDSESFDAFPAKGDCGLAAFVVSDDGRPIVGSELLSGCAWALGRAVDPGPQDAGWLQGLEDAEGALNELFDELVDAPDEDEVAGEPDEQPSRLGRPLSVEDLLEFTQSVIGLLGVECLAASGLTRRAGRYSRAKGSRLSNWRLPAGSAPVNTGVLRVSLRHLPSREP